MLMRDRRPHPAYLHSDIGPLQHAAPLHCGSGSGLMLSLTRGRAERARVSLTRSSQLRRRDARPPRLLSSRRGLAAARHERVQHCRGLNCRCSCDRNTGRCGTRCAAAPEGPSSSCWQHLPGRRADEWLAARHLRAVSSCVLVAVLAQLKAQHTVANTGPDGVDEDNPEQ